MGRQMNLRKIVTTTVVAAMFFWAPTAIPARATGVTCGFLTGWWPSDTAFAAPGYVPCPVQLQHATTPWAVIIFGASVVSVITNAIYVSQTQCRELTTQEAWTSIGLPFIGIAFDQHNDKCHPVPKHH